MKPDVKNCISCGIPIRRPEEAAMGDINKPYCHLCARPDGTLKSFDEVHAGMTQFFIRSQGLDQKIAGDMARQMMNKMPAWKGLAED